MTVSIYANGVKVPEENLPDLQIWNQTLQGIFNSVTARINPDDGGWDAA